MINKIVGYCGSCEKNQTFTYLGYMPEDKEFGIEYTELYNCECRTTLAIQTIKENTRLKLEECLNSIKIKEIEI